MQEFLQDAEKIFLEVEEAYNRIVLGNGYGFSKRLTISL